MTTSLPIRAVALVAGLWAGTAIFFDASLPAEDVHPTTAEAPWVREEFLQIRMGIPVRILVYAPSSTVANEATDAAYRRIRQIDRLMSDYDPDSELMQLTTNAEVGTSEVVSEELFHVLEAAQQLSRQSRGAFDVTIAPVVKLWRIARRRQQLPDNEALDAARKRVGTSLVVLDSQTRSVTFQRAEMQLDLGGIAKGYAADQALKVLREHGVSRALIDAGGDIVVGDPPPDRDFWRIEVEVPGDSGRGEKGTLVLELKNQAVATSGDAYQFIQVDGVRYSHLIDPRTGMGLTTPGSVSVVAPTGMQADGLASAVSVMGPEQGLELIHQIPETEALIFQNPGEGKLQKFQSAGWERLLQPNEVSP